MALTNLIHAVTAVSAAVLLLRSDSAAIFRRNLCHIRHCLEEESKYAAKSGEGATPKELDSHAIKKDIPKGGKH